MVIPQNWNPSREPAKPGSEQRFRVEVLKFNSRGHVEHCGRLDFCDESEAIAAFNAAQRPARVRARCVATLTQEWLEPATNGVRFAVHRMYTDGHARRELAK